MFQAKQWRRRRRSRRRWRRRRRRRRMLERIMVYMGDMVRPCGASSSHRSSSSSYSFTHEERDRLSSAIVRNFFACWNRTVCCDLYSAFGCCLPSCALLELFFICTFVLWRIVSHANVPISICSSSLGDALFVCRWHFCRRHSRRSHFVSLICVCVCVVYVEVLRARLRISCMNDVKAMTVLAAAVPH